MTRNERVSVAELAAREGGNTALEEFREGIDVETKGGKTNVVTQADRDAQNHVIDVIKQNYSDDAIVGEEEDELKEMPESGLVWVIDPIDGTNNFVRNIRFWTTSVAAVRDGETLGAVNYLPALDDIYVASSDGVELNGERVSVSQREDPETFTVVPTVWWDFDRRDEYAAAAKEIVERFGDMRRFGSAQAVLSMVAAGSLEGAITNVEVNPWDSIAGVFMIRQAGGKVTDIKGDRWEPGSKGLVASNGTAHDELLVATQAIEDDKQR